MSNDRGVSPWMLSVDAHFTILVDDQSEGFIKPPDKCEKIVQLMYIYIC